MEKKNISKIIIVVVAVALVLVLAGGATFAYWQWQTSTAQQTLVNVTVEEGITMTIIPVAASNAHSETTTNTPNSTANGLYPTKVCNQNAILIGTAAVTINNETRIKAEPLFKLKATLTVTSLTATEFNKAAYNTVKTNILSNMKWAIVKSSGAPTASSISSCDTLTALEDTGDMSELTWDGLTATGDITVANTVKFTAPALQSTTENYTVYVWLGSDYTGTNTGTTVSDPAQHMNVTVTWSENSSVTQVTAG